MKAVWHRENEVEEKVRKGCLSVQASVACVDDRAFSLPRVRAVAFSGIEELTVDTDDTEP